MIDEIYNKVANTLEVNLVNDPLVGVLWNIGNKEIEEYDEVIALLMDLGSYTKNLIKLDLDLKNRESSPAK